MWRGLNSPPAMPKLTAKQMAAKKKARQAQVHKQAEKLQPKVDSLARGKSVCPKPKQFVLGGRGALGLIPDASWGGGKATAQRKM